MARFVLRGSILKKILIVVSCMLGSACVQTPVALAQHGGGHIGGGGAHVFAPPSPHAAISRPRVSAAPPVAAFGTHSFRFRPRHINPLPPVFPVYGYPFFFGGPFFGYGLGWGFNSFWWPTCGPYWGWQFGCNALPFYEYGPGNYGYPPTYEYPLYPYREEGRDLPQLYLKDGTVYNVTDYWLVDGQIHFTMLEEGGTKSVEYVIGFDELDLQKTIDVATKRGFRFVLRNEPVDQYLRDRPDLTPPVAPPPKNK
jgi:hypothetical protein